MDDLITPSRANPRARSSSLVHALEEEGEGRVTSVRREQSRSPPANKPIEIPTGHIFETNVPRGEDTPRRA